MKVEKFTTSNYQKPRFNCARRYAKLKVRGLLTINYGIERGYTIFQDLFGNYFGKIMHEMVGGKTHFLDRS